MVAGSLEGPHWPPSGEPRTRSLEKRQTPKENFNRYMDIGDLSIGQYAVYRAKYIAAGDLTESMGGFRGLVGGLSQMENVLAMSITGRPGIAASYGRRVRAMIQKAALKRPPVTDYFDLLINAGADIKGAAVRDFETSAELGKKDKENRLADLVRGKAKKNNGWGSNVGGSG